MAPAMLRSLTAAAGLLASLSCARPLERRAVVWETVTDVVVKTVDVTTTVTCEPGPPATYGPSIPVPTPATSSSAPPKYTPPAEFVPEPTSSTAPAEPPAYTPPPPPAYSSPAPPPPPPEYEPEPEPTPTPPPQPTYEPEPTPEPEPTYEPEPSPSPPSDGGGGECSYGSSCSGEMTYYGGGMGACGSTIDTSTDDAIALPHVFMGQESNSNDYCGQTVTIQYGDITSTAKIMDKCMGCEGYSIDMTEHLFTKFAALGNGRLSGVQWWFN